MPIPDHGAGPAKLAHTKRTRAVMKAGAARVDITPSVPVRLAGYPPVHVTAAGPQDHRGYVPRTGRHEGIHDPIYARALAIDDGRHVAVVVTLDLIAVTRAFTDKVRQTAAERWGLDPDGILLAASHTHSGPDYWGFEEPVDPSIPASVIELTVSAIGQALTRMRLAYLGLGRGEGHQLITNRRDRSRPVDPTVPVLRFEDETGATIAVLYSFECHPIIAGPNNRLLSAEYPGVVAAIVEKVLGGVCLFLNGAAGNVNPVAFPYREGNNIVTNSRDRSQQQLPDGRTLIEMHRFGCVLGAEVLRVAASIETTAEGTIEFLRCPVNAALKDHDELEQFLAHLDYAPAAADFWRRQPFHETEVAAMRLGPLTLLALPGEPFAEIGIELERDYVGTGFLRVVGYANDDVVYLLPPDQYAENRYETIATPLSRSGALAILDAATCIRNRIASL